MIDPASATPIETQPLPLEDFSGGMTDYYLGGPLNKCQRADNLLIVKHGDIGKLFTRPGSELYDSTYYQIPAGAQRIGTLKYFNSTLFYQSARKIYYVNSGWTTLQGPTSNDLFPSGIDTTHVVSAASWNGILYLTSSALIGKPSKIYKDSGAVWRLRTAGLPDLATSPTATPDTTGVISVSYLYRFLHKYTYTVGSVTYIDRGPITEVVAADASGSAIGAGTPCAIAAIPVLANSTTDNYDTASTDLKIEIYRTTDGGQNFFYTGQVSNGTTTFSDTTTDAVLVDNEPLYTESGAPDNDPPPLAKVIHIVDDRAFYGHCKIGSEVHTTRVYQAVPGDPDSVPLENFGTLPDDLVTISSYKSLPIVLCAGSLHRLDGAYDELGGGFLGATVISDTQGCVSQQSAVQTPIGIFWAGLDGFYWTDGYQSLRVSGDLRETYQSIISSDTRKRRIMGKYDAKENRVYWTAQLDSAASEVDALFCLDLNWQISEYMPFTTWSGGTNFAPTAIEFVGANLLRGDSRGYTFIHRASLYVDPKVNVAAIPSLWSSSTLIYDWVTCATNFGTSHERKFVPSCSVLCENETNLSLLIRSINDDGRRTADLKPVRYRGNVVWGDPDVYWGDPDIIWDVQGVIDEYRRMPAGSLRCQFKQAQLTNAHVAILSSDTLGTATVSTGALTATLDDTTFDWPTNSVDYYLAFASDGYVTEFLVTARTADVLTFATAGGGPPSGSQRWVLRGKPKGEVLYLNAFIFNYAIFGQTQGKFRQAGTGEVGAAE